MAISLFNAESARSSGEAIYTLPFFDGYYVSCGFVCYSGHEGTDIVVGSASAGENIVAAADGDAYYFNDLNVPGAGLHISMDHGNSNRSRYLHLDDWTITQQGQFVARGGLLGHEGSTGTSDGFVHLHFETRINSPSGLGDKVGTGVDPFNPSAWLWTTNPPSYADDCNVPPGGVADGALYRGETEGTVYRTYASTKYPFASASDFESMGTAQGFWWDDIICVPNGYLNGIGDVPPDKALLREYPYTGVYVYFRAECNAKVFIPGPTELTEMTTFGYANNPTHDVPPGTGPSDLTSVPEDGCHLGQHGSTAQYVTCSGPLPPPIPFSKWWIFEEYAVTRLGLNDTTMRTLWTNALNSVPNISLRTYCTDSDNDVGPSTAVWSNLSETYLGTGPTDNCADNNTANNEPEPDAWPPDFDDSQRVTMGDVLKLSVGWTHHVYENPPLYARLDLNVDGLISLPDQLAFSPVFGMSCAGALAPEGPEEPGSGPPVDVAIDLDTLGNAADGIGPVDACGTGSTQPLASGTSTGGNDKDTLRDTEADFDAGFADQAVRIVKGTVAGQLRWITTAGQDQLTVSPAWDTVPDATSSYEVLATTVVDLTVADIPAFDEKRGAGGIAGFSANVLFDPEQLAVVAVNPGGDKDTMLAADVERIPFEYIDADASDQSAQELPSTSGNLGLDLADLSQNRESGDGVAVRLLVVALSSGDASLTLDEVAVYDAAAEKYFVASADGAVVRVDGVCD